MRNELLQERASRQDLECDKMALERQVHTLLSAGKKATHSVTPQAQSTNSFHSRVFSSFSFVSILTSLRVLYIDMIMI